jgi:hypothetical protein
VSHIGRSHGGGAQVDQPLIEGGEIGLAVQKRHELRSRHHRTSVVDIEGPTTGLPEGAEDHVGPVHRVNTAQPLHEVQRTVVVKRTRSPSAHPASSRHTG